MVVIDQLRISDDGKLLYIDAHVNKASYFNDVYINEVTIVTDTQMESSTSSAVDSNYIYKEILSSDTEEASGTKEAHLVLRPVDMNESFTKQDFTEDMFFVYISATGTPSECTPCKLDEKYTIGVTFDYAILFNQALNYMKQVGDKCTIPKDFIDVIMKFHALKYSIETDHWLPAIEYFRMLKGNSEGIASAKPCGCRGGY